MLLFEIYFSFFGWWLVIPATILLLFTWGIVWGIVRKKWLSRKKWFNTLTLTSFIAFLLLLIFIVFSLFVETGVSLSWSKIQPDGARQSWGMGVDPALGGIRIYVHSYHEPERPVVSPEFLAKQPAIFVKSYLPMKEGPLTVHWDAAWAQHDQFYPMCKDNRNTHPIVTALGFQFYRERNPPSTVPYKQTKLYEYSVCVPHWLLLLLFFILPHIWFRHFRRQRYRLRNNLCLACGYDLRAHKPGNKCPECGTLIAKLPQPKSLPDQNLHS